MTEASLQAKKLFKKFKSCANGAVGSEKLHKNSRKCALVCVNEILKLRMIYHMGRGSYDSNGSEGYFWEEVRQEILKL